MKSLAPDSLPPSPHTPRGHFSIHLVITSIFDASGTVLDTRDSAQEKVAPVLQMSTCQGRQSLETTSCKYRNTKSCKSLAGSAGKGDCHKT